MLRRIFDCVSALLVIISSGYLLADCPCNTGCISRACIGVTDFNGISSCSYYDGPFAGIFKWYFTSEGVTIQLQEGQVDVYGTTICYPYCSGIYGSECNGGGGWGEAYCTSNGMVVGDAPRSTCGWSS